MRDASRLPHRPLRSLVELPGERPYYHNDLARTGQNLNETLLTPASVAFPQFGPLFSYPVDGQVYAQPLYLPGVIVPGKGIHNVVFIATEHDSVYAFDADNSLAAAMARQLPQSRAGRRDRVGGGPGMRLHRARNRHYRRARYRSRHRHFVCRRDDRRRHRPAAFVHRLHALDVATGAEKPGSPVEIQASAFRAPATAQPQCPSSLGLYKERAGLLLLNGVVYTAWSSQCDFGKLPRLDYRIYAGERSSNPPFLRTRRTGKPGSFWQGGAAPAADSSGNIYAVSANGTFDANLGGFDLAKAFSSFPPPHVSPWPTTSRPTTPTR
jgi:hypothetical protein